MKKEIPDYSSYFYFSPLPSWVYDRQTFQILDVNQAAIDHYGYSKEEFLGMTINGLFAKQEVSDRDELHSNLENRKGNIYFGVFSHQKKNGDLIRMKINGHIQDYLDFDCMILVGQDVTEEEIQFKQQQTSEKRLKAASEIAKLGYWRLELDANTLSWTDEVYTIWGEDKNRFNVNYENFFQTIHPDDREAFEKDLDAAFTGEKSLNFIHRIILSDGGIKWVHELGRLVKGNNGRPIAFEGTVQDITERKEAELRLNQISEKLSESEKRFRIAQEMSPDGFTILRPLRNEKGEIVDFTWVFENKAIADINGTDPDAVIGKRLLDLFPTHRGTDIFESYSYVADTRKSKIIEEVYIGEIISVPTWLRLVIVPMGDDIAILNQDITERKMAEKAVRESEAKFRTIFEIASLGMAQVDPTNGQIQLVNSYYESITGYSMKELLKMSFVELTHPDDREKDWEIFSKAVRGEGAYRNEKRYIKKDGSIVWVRLNVAFIRDEKGKPISTVAICEDITERKEAELRLHSLAGSLPGVVFQYFIYPDGTETLRNVSKGAEQIWGYSPEDVAENIDLMWNQIRAGGEFDQVQQSIRESLKTKSKWISRYKSVSPSGEVRTLLGTGIPNFWTDGTVVYNTVVLDMTQETKNEELLEQASDMAKIGSWEIDLLQEKMFWSDMVHHLHETDPKSFVPDYASGLRFFREDFREQVQATIDKCVTNGERFDFEAILITAKNNERWVRSIGKPEFVDGNCHRIYGSFQDINDHKKIEIALQKSLKTLEDYKFSLDQSAIIAFTDARGVISYVNENFCGISKFSKEELIGNTHQLINSGHHPKSYFVDLWKTISSGKVWRGDIKNLAKDGSYYWVDTTIVPFLDEKKKPIQYLAIRFDITHKKFADEKVIQTLEEKNNILESIGDAFYAVDRDWIVTYWNKQAENLVGLKREDIIGRNIWDVYPDAFDMAFGRQYRKAMKTGETVRFEEFYKYESGIELWLDVSAYPSRDGLSIYFKDITERKEADGRLLEAYEEKNNILERIGDAFIALDKDWKVTYSNKRAEEIIGIPREDLIGHNLWEKFPLAKDLEFFKQYERAFKTQTPVYFEEYFQPSNQWYETNAYPSPEGISVFFRDITDKKIAEKKILAANERFEKVTEATNDAIWDYDVLTNNLFLGKGFYTLFGYNPDDTKPSFDLLVSRIHEEDSAHIVNQVNKYFLDPSLKVWMEEYRFLKADGTYAFVIDRATFLRNSEGKVIRVIGAMNDISERKDFERQLIALNKSLKQYAHDLELSNEQLEQFAYIASHDLQEPLRMVSSFMDQLKRKYQHQLDDKALEYIHFATDGAKRMKRIILDLLEYSRAGRLAEQKETVDLNDILSEYRLLRRKVISEKSVKFDMDNLPVLRCYKSPLIQTLHSLLDNAIKYSKPGVSPHISIASEEIGDFWKISISDNGIGIEPEFFEKIFIIFQRLHNRELYDGTGIGLSIAKKHVESWGGKIDVVSTPEKGSTFYFTIPILS